MHAIASEKNAAPNGSETADTGKLKRKAAMRKVAVVVCPIRVDLQRVSNIATSPVAGYSKKWESDHLT